MKLRIKYGVIAFVDHEMVVEVDEEMSKLLLDKFEADDLEEITELLSRDEVKILGLEQVGDVQVTDVAELQGIERMEVLH